MNCLTLICLLSAILALSEVDGFKFGKFGKNTRNRYKLATEKYKKHVGTYREWVRDPANFALTTAGLAYSSVLLEEYLEEKKVLVPEYKDMEPYMETIVETVKTVSKNQREVNEKKKASILASVVFCVISFIFLGWSIYDFAQD